MIADQIPEIKALPLDAKRRLMNELWEEIYKAGVDAPDPALEQLLRERWAQYEQQPDSAITLEEFRLRLGISQAQ